MLDKNYQTRLSADDCISHLWIQNRINKQSVSEPILKESVDNLCKFTQTQKLNQAVSSFVAFQMATNEEKQTLEQLFKSMDINNDGKLSHQELLKGFKDRFVSEEEAEQFVQNIMEKCDSDNSGFIEFNEFISACMDKRKLLSNERIDSAFKTFDIDGSSKISFTELKKIIGGGISQKSWQQICKDVDSNGDGEVNINSD